MAFPDDVLTDEEEVVLHLHPHAKAAVRPILVLLFCLAAVILVWVMLPPNTGGLIGVCVVGAVALFFGSTRGVWPLLVWRNTHYVFTDERILLQDGVVARQRRDLPLNRVNDHVTRQSLVERMLGCGTLTVDSIGEQSAVMVAVPHVQQVQTTLYELIETDRELRPDDEDEDDEEPEPPVLRQRGAGRRSPWRSPRPSGPPPRR
ncbi:membrane protein [Actinoplanes sp. NBRC 14428]|uniref:PH (Pleckstrin Homology) domain-containing protein n=1 Tax=Pseudosporangium ferrugineum TaxID=439699 RepID=A0A2T0S4I1_9ACTN|nr:PH domain-containing protein [Pseudosporangium ferrugineum]PRY28329.1 PH (Pleckstrin Homology) domain-containing protein [Pseudosporangium ferrugineum]BCJ54041.1 membrane protein [Actinoplanes sp. NBRC 14428]